MTPKNTERLLATVVALALVAPAAMGAASEPRFQESSERYELENSEISVWFQGKKPLLKVFPSENESRSYQFHMLRVVEFNDTDEDGAYDEDEGEAFVNLARADAYDVETRAESDAVHVSLHMNTTIEDRSATGAPTTSPLPGDDEPRANLTITFHVYGSNTTIETVDGPVTVEPAEVKYDIAVHRWDWRTEDGQLAFVGEVPADNGTETKDEDGDRVSVRQNGTEIGYAEWLDRAEIETENGTELVEVTPTVKEQDNGTALVAWAYNGTGYESLLHDPTMGVTSASTETSGDDTSGLADTPAPGLAAVAAALVAVGAAKRVRKP